MKGAAKACGGWQESVDFHMAMMRGDDVSVQWMTEQGVEKDWTGNDGPTVTVAVEAVATADVAAAVVAMETAMTLRRWQRRQQRQ